MSKIKAVIFDLDGTLANTLPLCILAFRKSVEPVLKRPVSDEEIIATFGPSEEGTIMALIPDHYEQGMADYLKHYQALHDMCPAPFDGMEEILRHLHKAGVRVALVTGKGQHSTDISLEQFKLKPYFEVIETGDPAGPRKPEGIQQVLQAFAGIHQEEVIYVGDAPSDITASRTVGIPVVAAAWAETTDIDQLKTLAPDKLFTEISDFARWIYQRIEE